MRILQIAWGMGRQVLGAGRAEDSAFPPVPGNQVGDLDPGMGGERGGATSSREVQRQERVVTAGLRRIEKGPCGHQKYRESLQPR